MINIFLNGFIAFQNYFWIIICILFIVLWGWSLTQILLEKFFAEEFADTEYLSLSSVGWVFLLFIWAGMFFCVNFVFGKTIAIIFSIVIFLIPFLFFKPKRISISTLGWILFFATSLIVRFAFLEKATLPSYFDSAEHYRIIKYFVNGLQGNHFTKYLLLNYYHLGYHLIISTVVYVFNLGISDAMLVFGQIIIAILPLSFFFVFKRITDSNTITFFSCLFASFGLHMPAHLVNWGKYPALLSLLGIQFVFLLGYFLSKSNHKKSKYYLLFFLSISLTTLIHTRSLVVFALILITFFLMQWYKKIPIRFQYITITFFGLILAGQIFFVGQNPALSLLITSYAQRDFWSLVFIFLLFPFVIRAYPDFFFFILFSLCLFIFLLFLPFPFFSYGTQTLLDRPFVQMLIYIPFSIFTGLGFSSLSQSLKRYPKTKLLISFVLFSFVIFNAKINYPFYSSDCCQLVSEDDLSAINWIDEVQPSDVRILIASNPLYVTSFEVEQIPTGVDAGIWIPLLTSRFTLMAPTNLNFEDPQTFSSICDQQVKLIYLGSMPQRFNEIQLKDHPTWYQVIFSLSNVQIYEVNCR